jgi:hypothetical protein
LPILGALAVSQWAALAGEQEKFLESIVPALEYGAGCQSTVELRNLGAHPIDINVEGHKSSGALVPLVGRTANVVHLAAGQRGVYQLEIADETAGAWVKVRAPSSSIAVAATTECIVANQLRTAHRDVAFPTRNPWYSSDTAEPRGSLISLINTTADAAKATVCYSSGNLFSVPSGPRTTAGLQPICSTAFEVRIPPFGSREFPAERDGSSHFSLKTEGSAIVLEMLRPLDAGVKVYAVDSAIHFGGELPAPASKPSR